MALGLPVDSARNGIFRHINAGIFQEKKMVVTARKLYCEFLSG
jgi:hypothetical protein